MKKGFAFFITVGLILLALGVLIFIMFTAKTKEVPCDTFLSVCIYAVSGVFCLGGIAAAVAGIKELGGGSLLDKEGIFTDGQIIATNQSDGVTYARIQFIDSDGNVQVIEECFYSGRHRNGDKVAIKYAKKKNGKVVGQALDRG